MRDLVFAGNSAQMADAAFVRELKTWLRYNPRQAIDAGDGLFSALTGNPTTPAWLGPYLISMFFSAKAENEKYARQIASSAGIAVFVSQQDNPEHWVLAGRASQRFALQATALVSSTPSSINQSKLPASGRILLRLSACLAAVPTLSCVRLRCGTSILGTKASGSSLGMSETTHWDAIVIGSGLGGLSAAAAFANRGKRVLVLERLANFGGAATVYRHGALTMEASLHETDGDTVFGPNSVFARLGLTGAVEAIETDVFYEARGGALAAPIQIPAGLDNAHESLSRSLPEASAALDAYFRELKHLYRTLQRFGGHGLARPVGSARNVVFRPPVRAHRGRAADGGGAVRRRVRRKRSGEIRAGRPDRLFRR